MRNLIETVIVGLLMFIVIIGIIFLIGYGLAYLLTIIDCTVYAYIVTGVLLGLFIIIANLILKTEK